jgi:RsiW-degrading membrane proteinase PrsW (M82 family)
MICYFVLVNLTKTQLEIMDTSTIIHLGILALAPCLAIMIFIYWKDKFDKEPLKVLSITFFLGMLSALPVMVIGSALESIGFVPTSNSLLWSFVSMFIAVALVEETCKFLAVILYARRQKAFNEPFDGITYGVMSAMGFASLENLLYVFLDNDPENVAWMRMFTAVPAHAFFGIISGYFLGLQQFSYKRGYGLLGLILAAFLHTSYNFFLVHSYYSGLILGALTSLIIGLWFSLRAIKLHNAMKLHG